ncbi:MAG: hypothetical protein ACFFD7_11760 [Candidatus Thorarchaeota archaeon]
MKRIKKTFRNLKTSRKISLVLFFFFFLLGQIASILCAISIINISMILSEIRIPSGFVYLDLDIYTPENMTVQVPYEIHNPGIYDLFNIHITVDLYLNYINKSNQVNITSHVFSTFKNVGICKIFNQLTDDIEGEFSDFFIPSLVDFFNNVNEYEQVLYLLDIQFSANYLYGLIFLNFKEFKIKI